MRVESDRQAGVRYERHAARGAPRLLIALLGVSAAIHAAVLGVLPGFLPGREVAPVTVFEVVLVQGAPAIEPVAVRPEPARERPERTAANLRAQPAPPTLARTEPVLALPEPGPASEPVVAVPPPGETRAAPAEPKTEVAAIALTPPSFSAEYLRNPPPRYPLAARRSGEQGTVTLRVLITREGTAARVELGRSSGSVHLDSAALESVKSWRFVPARRGAEPVESWWVVPIVFRLKPPG
jgi:protein TonB